MKNEEFNERITRTEEMTRLGIQALKNNPLLLEKLNHWNGYDFWLKEVDTWEEAKKLLSWLRRGGIKMEVGHYYTSSMGGLSIHYRSTIGECSLYGIILICRETEVALASVSNGKCRIIEQSITEPKVICELPNGERENHG